MKKSELKFEKTSLPANIKELSRFVLVGREKLTAVRAEIRAIDKVGLARQVREQKLQYWMRKLNLVNSLPQYPKRRESGQISNLWTAVSIGRKKKCWKMQALQ